MTNLFNPPSHRFYPSGPPRFNHVAMSVPADLLGEESRKEILGFFDEVLGFEEMPTMTEDRRRMILGCVHWDQFIFLVADDDPMKCPRLDHYGFSVGSLDELRGIQERAEAFRAHDDRVDLIDLHVDDQGVVKIHSLYVHYILPMMIEFQYWEFAFVRGMVDREAPSRQAELAATFLRLHQPGTPLLMPNAWDVGSAVLLAALGFDALATTSGGFAASKGRLDGSMRREEVLAHAQELAAATALPLSADLENCFAHEPDGVAETARAAVHAGVAGFSVEDFTGNGDDPIYELDVAAERVRAACEVAHDGDRHIVVTARAENYLHGHPDLADTIARLQAYQSAGADVVFAPRVDDPSELHKLVGALDVPVSVLAGPNAPNVAELSALGVSRVSVGGAFAVAAYGALVDAATELRDAGTYGYWELTKRGNRAVRDAFSR